MTRDELVQAWAETIWFENSADRRELAAVLGEKAIDTLVPLVAGAIAETLEAEACDGLGVGMRAGMFNAASIARDWRPE